MATTSKNDDALLAVEQISLDFGGVAALSNVTLSVRPKEIFSIIGPNGAGKTSLLNVIGGFYKPRKGRIYFEGKEISEVTTHKRAALGIARTFQNIELFGHMTVLENLLLGAHIHLKSGPVGGGVYWKMAEREEIAERERIEEIIDFLEIEQIRNSVAGQLSYGLQKRVELGRAMAMRPKLLILDEPMAGMTIEEKQEMVRFIIDLNEENDVTIVLIEHDMGVVMDISDRMAVLDFGKKIAQGTPESVRSNENVIKAYLGQKFVREGGTIQ